MHNRIILRSIFLFLLTICWALAIQKSSDFKDNDISHTVPRRNEAVVRDRRAFHYQKKPGFFRTLFSVIFEQWSDTKNTVNKVNTLINDNFLPENAPVTQPPTTPSDPNISTTAAPFKITRSEFNKIIQRNLKGIVRLFNLELQDALKQSEKTRAEFRRNASIEVSKFL